MCVFDTFQLPGATHSGVLGDNVVRRVVEVYNKGRDPVPTPSQRMEAWDAKWSVLHWRLKTVLLKNAQVRLFSPFQKLTLACSWC